MSNCSIINYKCVCIISFIFSKFRSTGQNHSSTAEEISTRLLKLHVPELIPANIFLSHHTRGGHSHSWSSSLTFWTLNYLIFKERKGRKIFKLTEILIATRSLYNYSKWERTGVRTFGVRLQQRSSKVKWNWTWNLTLRRWILNASRSSGGRLFFIKRVLFAWE